MHTSIQSISASYNGKYTGTKLNLTGNVAKLGAECLWKQTQSYLY